MVWTFSASHAESLMAPVSPGGRSLIDRIEEQTGVSIDVELMTPNTLDLRLMTLLRAGDHRETLPDVVHLEILSAAKYLEPDGGGIGLLPLDDHLARSGLLERLMPSRLASWSRGGRVYGIPLGVHPVTLTWRRDLFEAAGLDPAACRSWDELADVLRRYCAYWEAHGRPGVRALELSRTRSDHITLMLQQRGVALVDDEGRPNLRDPHIAPTVAFHAELLAGDTPVAIPTSEGHGRFAGDLVRGDVAMIWTPDWRIEPLESAAPELAGKLAMMPLPPFEPGDARTAPWGGSMLAIPRGVADPDAAFALAERLAASDDALAARRRDAYVVPALRNPMMYVRGAGTSPLYGEQPIRRLYAELAAEAGPERVTPLSLAAAAHLAAIVSRSAEARQSGLRGEALEAQINHWLADAQADLLRRARFASGGARQ